MPHGRKPVGREETDLGWLANTSSGLLDSLIAISPYLIAVGIVASIVLTLIYGDKETKNYVWGLILAAAAYGVLYRIGENLSLSGFVQLFCYVIILFVLYVIFAVYGWQALISLAIALAVVYVIIEIGDTLIWNK